MVYHVQDTGLLCICKFFRLQFPTDFVYYEQHTLQHAFGLNAWQALLASLTDDKVPNLSMVMIASNPFSCAITTWPPAEVFELQHSMV